MNYEKEIVRLKKEMNAVILAHFYQYSEIQDIADHVGDSLELARRAASTEADVIVFAGVHFMAETAKILNPGKTVLLPDLEAGCSLADDCPAALFKPFREKHPDHLAVTYINCSAEVKALSDIICTSSSAEKIISQIPETTPILFSPDKNLGAYLQKKTGRTMLLWDGSCIVHRTFSEQKIIGLQLENSGAELIAHPECEEHLLAHAQYVGSTSKLLQYVRSSPKRIFIVATEPGILHQMQILCPGKKFIPAPPEANCACNECPHMKKNTLEKLYRCMQERSPKITMPDELLARALKPMRRMMEMS